MSRSPFTVLLCMIALSGCRFGNSHPHPKSPASIEESATTAAEPDELHLRSSAAHGKQLPNGAKALLDSTVSVPAAPKEQTAAPAPSPTPHPLGHPEPLHPLKESLAEDIGTQIPEPERRAAAVRTELAQQAADQRAAEQLAVRRRAEAQQALAEEKANEQAKERQSVQRQAAAARKAAEQRAATQNAAAQELAQRAALDSLPDPKPTTPSGGYGDTAAQNIAGAADKAAVSSSTPAAEDAASADIAVRSRPNSIPAESSEARARLDDRSSNTQSLFSSLSGGGRTLLFEFAGLLLLVAVFFAVLWMRLDREFGSKRKGV